MRADCLLLLLFTVCPAGVLNVPFKDDSGKLQPQYKCYLVMELLGHNLYELCAVYGKHRVTLTPQDFVALGQAMLRALQHVHTCGLVHRCVNTADDVTCHAMVWSYACIALCCSSCVTDIQLHATEPMPVAAAACAWHMGSRGNDANQLMPSIAFTQGC